MRKGKLTRAQQEANLRAEENKASRRNRNNAYSNFLFLFWEKFETFSQLKKNNPPGGDFIGALSY